MLLKIIVKHDDAYCFGDTLLGRDARMTYLSPFLTSDGESGLNYQTRPESSMSHPSLFQRASH